MISAHLAGGDCLNVGCVPSKALIRCAKAIREVKKATEFGVIFHNDGDEKEKKVDVDFGKIMERMRKLRSEIAPIDGHKLGTQIGVDVYQGFGKFLDERTIEVVDSNNNPDATKTILKFKKAVIATGGKASIPTNIPGLEKAPYTTNETLFNVSIIYVIQYYGFIFLPKNIFKILTAFLNTFCLYFANTLSS